MHQTAATAVGITLALCCVAVSRARGGGSPARSRRRSADSGGLVDLLRDEHELLRSSSVDAELPPLSRTELAAGRLVVVVIGPSSTGVHQSYVVNKLLRYLRWSNLIRRHFRISEEEEATTGGLREEPSSDSTNDLTDSAESCSSDSDREKACPQAVADSTARASSTAAATAAAAAPAGLNGAHTNGNGYTYSDRGKAAALTTIAVQESAKKVTNWLNNLKAKAGGVAVVETGRSGWASTRQGRQALPGFLRQTAGGSHLGILWVELLPSGLYHRAEPPPPRPHQQPPLHHHHPTQGSGRAPAGQGGGGKGAAEGEAEAAWKSTNGLARGVPKAPGGNVVETFLHSGNLVGAGGHVIYESLRRGKRGESGVRGKSCFVSLADQGLDVQSQLEDDKCPLLRRVGNFAAALRMKKSWHGCPVYLTRHGESVGNQSKSMGGDGRLSERGDRYASVLANFVAAQPDAGQSRLLVWCSPMRRATQTARAVKCHRYKQWQALTELDTGVFNGFSYKQVEKEHPEEFAAREADKLCYRYPEGEGYLDVVNRLDPVVVALEREDRPVLIISHQACLRCLYAYFHDMSLREMPRIPISLHTVVKLTPIDFYPELAAATAPRFWKELRFELIKQTPLEQFLPAAMVMGDLGLTTSQLGESLA